MFAWVVCSNLLCFQFWIAPVPSGTHSTMFISNLSRAFWTSVPESLKKTASVESLITNLGWTSLVKEDTFRNSACVQEVSGPLWYLLLFYLNIPDHLDIIRTLILFQDLFGKHFIITCLMWLINGIVFWWDSFYRCLLKSLKVDSKFSFSLNHLTSSLLFHLFFHCIVLLCLLFLFEGS